MYSLALGKTEVGPDEAPYARHELTIQLRNRVNVHSPKAYPEESSVSLPVPSGGIHHVGVQDTRHDTNDVVQVSGQTDGLGPQSSTGDFTNDTI